jgi:hypothetical protein
MTSEYDRLKHSGELDVSYGTLRAALETIDVIKSGQGSTVSKDQYEKLVEKFEKAMQMIEVLRTKIAEVESNKLPTKEEVESISSMLDIINKLDDNSIARINRLGGMSKK